MYWKIQEKVVLYKKTNCKIEDLVMENQPLCFADSIEVIGNIYENPELLKGEI